MAVPKPTPITRRTRTIWITRAQPGADQTAERVRALGHEVLVAPLLEVKAVAPDIHRFIGPYVGLIITNCIIMGRAEAFASPN